METSLPAWDAVPNGTEPLYPQQGRGVALEDAGTFRPSIAMFYRISFEILQPHLELFIVRPGSHSC